MATYFKGDVCIAITVDPCHKRKGLYIGNRYCIQRVATFSSDDVADAFDKFFCKFIGAKEAEHGMDQTE